jgi:hypothetical protein
LNKETLEKILSHLDAPSSQDIIELEEMCVAYPFYPPPFIALAKILKNKGNYTYEMMLQKAALRIHDREQLHGYIMDGESIWHQPQFTPPVITDLTSPPLEIESAPAVEATSVETETTPTAADPVSIPVETETPTAADPVSIPVETETPTDADPVSPPVETETPTAADPVSPPPTITAPPPPAPDLKIAPVVEATSVETETTPTDADPVSPPVETETPTAADPVSPPPTITAPPPPAPDLEITPAVETTSSTPSAFPAHQTGSFAFWLKQFSTSSNTSQPTTSDSAHQLPVNRSLKEESPTLRPPEEHVLTHPPTAPTISIRYEQIPSNELQKTPSETSEEIQLETTVEVDKTTHNASSEDLLTYFDTVTSDTLSPNEAVTQSPPSLHPLPPTTNPDHQTGPPVPPSSETVDPIDLFLARKPEISRPPSEFFNAEKAARKSLIPPDDLISETLAKIYINQGHYQKAINVYEKLSLKFPSKKLYFAATIEKLKDSTDL